MAAALVAPEAVAAAAAAVAEAEERVEQCRAAVDAGEAEIASRLPSEQTALDAARQVEARLARLKAEAEALRSAARAGAGAPARDPPILSALRVAAGFEAAIGAVFDDELARPLAEGEAGSGRDFWVESRRRSSTARSCPRVRARWPRS